MNFDTLVKERANKRTQAKIKTFRETVTAAAQALTGHKGGYPDKLFVEVGEQYGDSHTFSVLHRSLLAQMLTPPKDRGWPASLWRTEEELVSKDLFATMDEIQKALVAAKTPRPEDEEQEANGSLE